jgi:hypothetical protein
VPGEFYIEGKKEKVDISQILATMAELEQKLTLGLAEVEEKMKSLAAPVDFWSMADDVIDLPAVATHVNLPDVVVDGLPAGIALIRVVAILKVRAIENTNVGGPNAISGAQAIRVKKSAGSWGADDVVAIYLPDNLWAIAASTRESGDLVIGNYDVKSKVDSPGAYNFRFHNARVDLDYLRLNDVMVGLRFYISAQ